jgi:heme/copper-type cytochrome/quinol oxidase subunit 1
VRWQRAPCMSLDRIPLFVWSMLVTAFAVILEMPAIMVASTSLILDRLVGTHFFNPSEGGDVLLWQHLFWFFGHPEVYIIFLPAVGMVSTILPTFARRPVFGYLPLVLSAIATCVLAFGLWVHHKFATDLPRLGESSFTASSMAIAIPNGVQIFCWVATLVLGRPVLRTPLLCVLAFFFTFIIGGMTGVMVASVPLDSHDTYFVVAHFHHVVIGGTVFPLMGVRSRHSGRVRCWAGRTCRKAMSKRGHHPGVACPTGRRVTAEVRTARTRSACAGRSDPGSACHGAGSR